MSATAKQRAVLVAYLRLGSYKKAAEKLGINENTARTRIGHCLKVNECDTVAQLAYKLAIEGLRV